MPTYVFDPTGQLPANRIPNEPAVISSINGVNNFLFVPEDGPFFGDTSFTLVSPSGNILEPGDDYLFVYQWQQASDVTSKEVYGAVVLTSPTAAPGTYRMTYQTIGGEYVDTPPTVLISQYVDLQSILNLDFSTVPVTFPITPHQQPLDSLNGAQQIVDRLIDIAQAVANPDLEIRTSDIVDFGQVTNPLISELSAIVTAIQNGPTNGISQSTFDTAITGLSTQISALTNTVTAQNNTITTLQTNINALQESVGTQHFANDLAGLNTLLSGTEVDFNETVFVQNATPDVGSGWAIYKKINGAPGNGTILTASEEALMGVGVPSASTTVPGITPYATDSQAVARSSTNTALTPSNLQALTSPNTVNYGLTRFSTGTEINTGDASTALSPDGFRGYMLDSLGVSPADYTARNVGSLSSPYGITTTDLVSAINSMATRTATFMKFGRVVTNETWTGITARAVNYTTPTPLLSIDTEGVEFEVRFFTRAAVSDPNNRFTLNITTNDGATYDFVAEHNRSGGGGVISGGVGGAPNLSVQMFNEAGLDDNDQFFFIRGTIGRRANTSIDDFTLTVFYEADVSAVVTGSITVQPIFLHPDFT